MDYMKELKQMQMPILRLKLIDVLIWGASLYVAWDLGHAAIKALM